MAIKKLTKDEAAQRSTNVDGETVRCVRTVKPDNDAPVRYVVEWTFNFANVTTAELMELATARLVIDTQREWRALPDAERTSDKWAQRTISVRTVLDRERSRGTTDPLSAAVKLTAKMSAEQLAQLKLMLNA